MDRIFEVKKAQKSRKYKVDREIRYIFFYIFKCND